MNYRFYRYYVVCDAVWVVCDGVSGEVSNVVCDGMSGVVDVGKVE